MQPQHYILAIAALWLFTLTFLPFLFATARRRAFAHGLETGKATHNSELKRYVKSLETDLAYKATELEEAKKNFTRAMNARRDTIAELEARIMSYTGMPVTRSDYDLLISSTETLRLAEKTWKAAPGTEPWRNRATQQMQDIQALAMRVHSQLRSTPASAASVGNAA